MVALARTKGYQAVETGFLNHPPFSEVAFDAILCLFSVFSYLTSEAERREAVAGFWKGLKEDGFLCIDITNRWHLGEEGSFKKSRFKIMRELLISIIHPGLSYGDVLFEFIPGGKPALGFFHTMTDSEFRALFQTYFDIEKQYIIGYDTGRIYDDPVKGNFLYICRKKSKKNVPAKL